MTKAEVLVAIFLVYWRNADGAVTTYQLNGRNTATVTTGSHTCCNRQSTDVTLSVQATLFDKSNTRTDFKSSRFDTRMTQLDKRPGDEKGHILASVFGGPAEIWNLAPQADNVNKRLLKKNSILVGWYECEKWIQGNLENGAHLPVRAIMRLTYENNNCRPTYWSIEARNSDPRDPGCKADNIINGYGGPFACRKA
ncbi:type VII secretion system protein EssD-like [Cylas formicarius]|uniref:type VII secretion system protein EssD-like n=1 Tax=Cylas formicarius TaxID=197179 RepID=UPI0029583DD0|nr:type VII secretion system protein EssD-like [Cylas formicarius]